MINIIISKHRIFFLFLLFAYVLNADEIIQHNMDARIRTTYEVIPLTNEANMGTLGTHFDWYPSSSFPSLYTGLGFLNAAQGEEGGFFAFGYTLGVDSEIYNHIHTDLGIYVGGGSGSYINFPNGGMIVRSHAALSYEIDNIELVLGVAHTNFPNTRANQKNATDVHPYIGVNIATDIWSKTLDKNSSTHNYKDFDGMFENIRITPAMLYYDVDNKKVKKPRYTGGAAYQENFPALGIQLDKFLNENIFVSFEAYGALSSAAGYAAIQAGLGYEYKLLDSLSWESKMVVGSAGDSRIDTGGGLIVQPMTGFRVALTPSVSFKTLVGRTYAPTGLFSATTYEAGLSFATSHPKVKNGSYLFSSSRFHKLKWTMAPSVKFYFPHNSTHKETQEESEKAISLVGVTLAVPLNNYLSLSGSTHWAMTGNIGSYAEGLFGAQLYSPTFSSLHIKAKLSAEIGAGAGAGINTSSGGFVAQLTAGAAIPLSTNTSLNAELGEMKTSDGRFNAHTLLLSLNIHLNYLYKR